MPGPQKRPLTDSSFLPDPPMAGDGGIAEMLARLTQRQASRRQGWGTGFGDQEPRELISPMDSISASDSAGGADISEDFPSTARGGGGGGAPAMTMPEDGMMAGGEGEDNYFDDDLDLDEGGTPAQFAQYSQPMGNCPGGVCPTPNMGGQMFAQPSQYQVFDSPMYQGLPPGAFNVRDVTPSGTEGGGLATAEPGTLVRPLSQRLADIDADFDPATDDLASQAARQRRRATEFRTEAEKYDAGDPLRQRPFVVSAQQADAQAEAATAQRIMWDAQAKAAEHKRNLETQIATLTTRQADEIYRQLEMKSVYSGSRAQAELDLLGNSAISPRARAELVVNDKKMFFAQNAQAKAADGSVLPLYADAAAEQADLEHLTKQATVLDATNSIALSLSARQPLFGIPSEAAADPQARIGYARQDPAFMHMANYYLQSTVSDQDRADAIMRDAFNPLSFQLAMALMREQAAAAGQDPPNEADYFRNPRAFPPGVARAGQNMALDAIRELNNLMGLEAASRAAASPAKASDKKASSGWSIYGR